MGIPKKIAKVFLPFLLMLMLAVSASAAEVSFSDVASDSPWLESIQYVADHGISVGTGNNCFSPDRLITCRQWAVMICRAFNKQPEVQSTTFGEAEIRIAYAEGWLNMYGVMDPDQGICRGAMYESAFKVFGIPTYSCELYDGGTALAECENCVRIAKLLGICPEAAQSTDMMTRGETAQLIHLLSTREFPVEEPPIMREMLIANPDTLPMNDYLLAIAEVPETVRNKFADLGWKYAVDCKAVARIASELNVQNCIGACSYQDKTIYVSDSKATLHEFGHFCQSVVGRTEAFKAIYDKEAKKALPLLREYSLTNSNEYFADCFQYWIAHAADTSKLEALRSAAPETYAYFEKLSTSGWVNPLY